MSQYHRPKVPGATLFFTVALVARGGDLLTRQVDVLREVTRRTKADKPFRIDAWVVLPDHMHCIWTLPEGGCGLFGADGNVESAVFAGIGEIGR